MIRLRDFDQTTLIRWWAEAPSNGRIAWVAKMGKQHRIHPKELEKDSLRRYMTKLVQNRLALPRNRAPTSADYDQAAERFLNEWFDQELQ